MVPAALSGYPEHKPGKVRVVFDCAARFGDTSLNDQLLQGPDLTNNLTGVLLRFRQKSVALMADVEQMFHQVRVAPDDCHASFVGKMETCPRTHLAIRCWYFYLAQHRLPVVQVLPSRKQRKILGTTSMLRLWTL